MNKTITSIAGASAFLFLVGCDSNNRPPPLDEKSSERYEVAALFEHDGCKVYRFHDLGSYRYFARCQKKQSTTSEHTESCGKGCTRNVQVVTTQEDKP